MTIEIIITLCLLLILAYLFDITSSRTKIPSVILLLLIGWIVRQGADMFQFSAFDLSPILPIFGTLGLILIVFEGSLELELSRGKIPLIGKSSFIALSSMLVLSFGIGYAFHYFGNMSFKQGLANAIPLGIISSAIAIPSVRNIFSSDREFVIYESSLSDIFGVIFFYFIIQNENIGTHSFARFMLELLVTLLISLAGGLGLSYLLNKIKHHVKFIPIILIIILIYAVSKAFYLPALIFIMLFGLFLGNVQLLKGVKYLQRLQPDILVKEVHKLKELTYELTFLVRSLFFLFFGYLVESHELLNSKTLVWAISISLGIYVMRFALLRILRFNLKPLLYIAPRGLITILLFISIPAGLTHPLVNRSLVIQVIVLTALVMMGGLMSTGNRQVTGDSEEQAAEPNVLDISDPDITGNSQDPSTGNRNVAD